MTEQPPPCPCCGRPVRVCINNGPIPDEIIQDAAHAWDVPAANVTGKGRERFSVNARHLAMALIHQVCPYYSRSGIASFFNRTDHGTVSHAITNIMQSPEGSRQKKLFRALLIKYGIGTNGQEDTITHP